MRCSTSRTGSSPCGPRSSSGSRIRRSTLASASETSGTRTVARSWSASARSSTRRRPEIGFSRWATVAARVPMRSTSRSQTRSRRSAATPHRRSRNKSRTMCSSTTRRTRSIAGRSSCGRPEPLRDVSVIGVGETEFGELWDRSFRDLGIEAGLKAIQDAKLRSEDIDAVYIGNMSAGKFIDQEHISALVADYSGLADMHLPTVRVEGGGACGAIALLQARLAIASGMHDIVVVGGAEKMTDVGDVQAAVAVKNHKNGALNPEAQFQKEITIETVLQAPRVAEPLGVFDCAPLSDGAAAVVLCEMQKARKFSDTPIRIAGSGQASDFLALHDRRDLTTLDATVIAGKRAFHEARLQPKDVQVAEVHDNFTISEILAIEDLRFIEKGKGGPATADGLTALNGKVSVNTSGGLKARGQPVGATGVAQAVEIVRQLRGEAGKRQVVGARHGLTHTLGGTGATAVVHIFERGD